MKYWCGRCDSENCNICKARRIRLETLDREEAARWAAENQD